MRWHTHVPTMMMWHIIISPPNVNSQMRWQIVKLNVTLPLPLSQAKLDIITPMVDQIQPFDSSQFNIMDQIHLIKLIQ